MAMNFPDNPSVDDEFTVGDQTWVWTGTTWDTVPLTEYSPSPHATTHELGGSDELTLDPTQVTGLDELNTGTAGFTAVSNGSSGLSYQPVSHNYIINGAFDIWQRGDGPFTGGYTADRWNFNLNGATASITKKEIIAGDIESEGFGEFTNYLEVDSSGGNTGQCRLQQKIEDVRTLSNSEAILSFWAKADTARNFEYRLFQIFGSGGSANNTTASGVFSVGTTWQRLTIPVFIDSISGKTVGDNSSLNFRLFQSADVAFTLDITGVQLEAGSIATPFKRNANSIGGELAACQRYYFEYDPISTTGIGIGYSFSSTTFRGFFTCPVQMRANPTFAEPTSSSLRIQVNGSVYTPSSFNSIEALPAQIAIIANTSGMPSNHAGIFTTPERVTFDAEL